MLFGIIYVIYCFFVFYFYIFQILLPTGTEISIENGFQNFLNMIITSSPEDWLNTEGLCGYYDGNAARDADLINLDGTASTQTDPFAVTWR